MVTERAPLVMLPGVAYLDPWRIQLPMSTVYGRSSLGSQPDAPALTFSWRGDLEVAWGSQVTTLEVGAPISVEFDPTGGGPWTDLWDDIWTGTDAPWAPAQRFTGRIGALTPFREGDQLLTQVTCVGIQPDLAYHYVGDVPWPDESELARVAHVAALAAAEGYTVVNQGDPAITILGRDIDRQPALDLLYSLANSTGALVHEDVAGQVIYEGAQVRAHPDLVPALVLRDVDILDGTGWAQSTDTILNELTVVYGVAPEGSERPTILMRDQASIDRYRQTRRQTISSELAGQADAESVALLVLNRRATPQWDAPQLLVRADTIPDAEWDQLMAVGVSSLVETQGVTPAPGPVGGVGRWFTEGWQETIDRDDTGRLTQTVQLAVSSIQRWAKVILETTMDVTVAPMGGPAGTLFTITAVLASDATGPLEGRTIQLLDAGSRVIGQTLTDAAGVATFGVMPGAGSVSYVARFQGDALYGANAGQVAFQVTPVTDTAIVLAASTTTPTSGQSVTFTATVTPAGAEGRAAFSYSTDAGVTWRAYQTAALVAGKASVAWASNGTSWRWRAEYQPASDSWAPATSNVVTVTVRKLTTYTVTLAAQWAATYQQSGGKRTDTTDCYQGYYSSGWGNQKSLVGISLASIPADATVTKVELTFRNTHYGPTNGGVAIIGSHTSAAEPATYPSGVTANRTQVSQARYATTTVDISSWAKAIVQSKSMRGIAFGPGPSTANQYYGAFAPTPTLRVTYTRYV